MLKRKHGLCTSLLFKGLSTSKEAFQSGQMGRWRKLVAPRRRLFYGPKRHPQVNFCYSQWQSELWVHAIGLSSQGIVKTLQPLPAPKEKTQGCRDSRTGSWSQWQLSNRAENHQSGRGSRRGDREKGLSQREWALMNWESEDIRWENERIRKTKGSWRYPYTQRAVWKGMIQTEPTTRRF